MGNGAGTETRRLRPAALALGLLCSVAAMRAARAGPRFASPYPTGVQQRQMNQVMSAPRLGELVKMRVYLKGEAGSPPLDSFRLASGKNLLWRFEKEDAFQPRTEPRGEPGLFIHLITSRVLLPSLFFDPDPDQR
jgi:hypothetical protein